MYPLITTDFGSFKTAFVGIVSTSDFKGVGIPLVGSGFRSHHFEFGI